MTLAAAFFLAASGLLRARPAFHPLGLLFWFLLLASAASLNLRRRLRPDARLLFPAGLAAVLAVNYLVQRTGGSASVLWPAYFVLLPPLALGPDKLRTAGGPLAAALGLEAAGLFLPSPTPAGAASLPLLLGHGLALGAATAIVGLISHRRQARAEAARREYDELRDQARSLNILGGGAEGALKPLSRDAREGHLVGGLITIEERLAPVLSLAAEALGAETAAVYWPDESGGSLVLRQMHPPEAEGQAEKKIPLASQIIGGVFRGGEAAVLGRLGAGDERLAGLPGRVVHSLAAAPATLQEAAQADPSGSRRTVLGVLVATSSEPDAFREKMGMLTGFADQVAGILHSTHEVLRSEVEGKKHELLSDASNALSASLKEDDILETLMNKTAAMMGYGIGAYFQVDGKDKVSLKKFRRPAAAAVGRVLSVRKGLLRYIIDSHRPLIFNDLGDLRRQVPVVPGLDLDCRSLVAVPVMTENRPTGIFLAADREPAKFDYVQLDILVVLANQVAVLLSNAALHRRMEQMAITDGLTGLVNHRRFHEMLEAALTRVKRHPEPLSLILLDIDFFKKVNDTHGHPFGDVVLKGVAEHLRSLAREVDVVARYGGEEMALLLVNTDRRGAESMAERVMKGLRQRRFRHEGREVSVTASLGSATHPDDGLLATDLIRAADEALYRSKRDGRDRHTPAGRKDRIKA